MKICRGQFFGVLAIMHCCCHYSLCCQWYSKFLLYQCWPCWIMVWRTSKSKMQFYDFIKIFEHVCVGFYSIHLQEHILSCYRLVQEIGVNTRLIKRSKALPQIRVMTRASIGSLGDSESSSSSAASSHKRRRISNSLWVDDDLETSD